MNESTRQSICEAASAEAATWPELTREQVEELRFLLSRPSSNSQDQRGAA
ncbi:hypothetical protein BAURA86_01639 [Brevibacterium aurantiacum]|uniref:Uncharacterized protein n=1 Tax=Brevibacterium aurantiacum TaxID=273384 RepID=A0A2H1JFJ2_BREAU|nr:hypothetical protein BAURA86_01639 [Brevibacterium aurantiacum]